MNIVIPDYIRDILNIINEHGEAYVVGGCVRDSLVGKTPHDWDITTDRLPSEVKEIFKDYKIINNNGEKHGTITLIYQDKQIEITTYRVDEDYLDGRHPTNVSFTRSLKNDLARRDFTINALAYNEKNGLVDYYNGLADLNDKLIRTVGEPEKRFSEDYLRILRGVRFVSKLGFKMEDETYKTSIALSHNILKYISGERIREELKGILLGPNVLYCLLMFHDIIFSVIPELEECYNFDQSNPYHIHDVYTHLCHVVSYTKPDFTTRLAALLHDIGKPQTFTFEYKEGIKWGHFYGHPLVSQQMAAPILERLRLSNEEIREINYLILEHDSIINENKKTLKQLIQRTPDQDKDLVLKLIDLKQADYKDHTNLKEIDYQNIMDIILDIYNNNEALTVKDLKVNGNDLMKLGYYGKEIGITLNKLLEKVTEDRLKNDYDELINYLENNKVL